MATIGSIISKLRGLIKAYSDDTNYTNHYLYGLLSSAKATVIRERAVKFVELGDPRCFCIGLEEANSHSCDCVPVGCTVLRTVYEIPDVIRGRNKSLIYIKTLGEKEIPIVDFREFEFSKYDDIKANKPVATWYNNRILLWNITSLKAIIICGHWQDIAEWSDIVYCESDNQSDCFDLDSEDFGLDLDLELRVLQLVLDMLKIPLSLNQDITNNTNEELKY